MIEKLAYFNELFDVYGELLTNKQRSMFQLYYQEDLSLQEIAENAGVSRSAVFESIKRTEYHLERFESLLKVVAHEKRLHIFLEELKTVEDKDVKLLLEKFKKEEI